MLSPIDQHSACGADVIKCTPGVTRGFATSVSVAASERAGTRARAVVMGPQDGKLTEVREIGSPSSV